MKQIRIYLLLASSGLLMGCAAIGDHIIDAEVDTRNHFLAQTSWHTWSWCYEDLDYPYHFARGFKAGYRDILDGGNGCQPTLPPRTYWKPKYQTADGRQRVNAWFDGFSHGALAAQQDGHGNLGEIPISPTARMNLQMANARPANVFGNHGNMSAGHPPEIAVPLTQPPLDAADGVEAAPGTTPDPKASKRPYE